MKQELTKLALEVKYAKVIIFTLLELDVPD